MQNVTVRGIRILGALAVLAVGAVHLQQYAGGDYASVPTIGPLFLLNAIASGIVGIALLLPIERRLGERHSDAAIAVLAVAGVAIAAGSLIALFISETSSLFGFTEHGYGTPIVAAIAAEGAAILCLVPVALHALRRPGLSRKRARVPRTGSFTPSRP